jgi:hypothetical protein
VFSKAFVSEEADGVEDKGSGGTTTVDIQKILEAFLHLSLRSICFTHEAFFW